MSNISVDREKCTLCGACVETCPFQIFSLEDSEVRLHHEEECMACGHCVSVCPVEAVTHPMLDLTGFLPATKGILFSPEAMYSFLRSRRSCRAYEEREVPRPILERLIDMGRYAPTGHNRQNVEFIVVQNKANVERLSKMAAGFLNRFVDELEVSSEPSPFKRMIYEFRLDYESSLQGKERIFRGAPVVILLHGPAEISSSIDNCLYAIFHIVMMAETLGLGTCINRRFLVATDRVPQISHELGIPMEHKIFGCVTVGYPKHKFHKLPSRKPPKVKWM
jgi:nitroreductase/NAD-dependent dihydropyrimidine dehydrogenase PreA subunit